jgi:GWxTD domain-containing protein
MRRSHLFLALAALSVACVASAQLSATFKEWPSSPAGFLLTKAEKKAYEALTTDAQAQAFIDLFWAKRDPDLNTPLNEFKLDFDAKVEAADSMFSSEKLKGSLSDRGRTLIVMGRPSGRQALPAGSVTGGDRTTTDSPYEQKGGTDIWMYRKDRLPAGVKQEEVLFVFSETRVGLNDYVLDRSDRRNSLAMKVLAEGPERHLVNPKLTEVPKMGLLPGSKAATAEQLAVFAGGAKWPQGAIAHSAEGMLSHTLHPLWILMVLPEGEPLATQALGRVRSATGEEKGTFFMPTQAGSGNGGRTYEFSLPLEAGTWQVEVALLGAAGPVAVTTINATTEAVPSEGTYFSKFYWGADVQEQPQAHLGDAFNIGGWHLQPRLNNTYTTKESLSYFCYVIRPTLETPAAAADPQVAAPEPKPSVTVEMALFQGDKKLSGRPAEPVQLSNITGDLWMYGSGLPMSIFRRGGDFRLELKLTDVKSGTSATATIPITIVMDAPAAPPALATP